MSLFVADCYNALGHWGDGNIVNWNLGGGGGGGWLTCSNEGDWSFSGLKT